MDELPELTEAPAYDELAAALTSAANAIPEHAKVLTDAAAVLISEHNKIVTQDDCEACQ